METQKEITANPFRILSIDGGGIRGIFPAKFLADIEAVLTERGYAKTQIRDHFDLICGTSTGGIIAIALSLGIPAGDIHRLYMENAGKIFGNKRYLGQLRNASYERTELERLIREKFRMPDGTDARLEDCKTPVCIPIYDLMQGKPSVLKSRYHADFVRDYHIPAYQAALATSAAPTYFNPYCGTYTGGSGKSEIFTNKVDGGVFANNPALLGIVEAQKAFGRELHELSVLSIGTGHQKFADACAREKWGLLYWFFKKRRPLIELFMQGQSQQVQNLISLLNKGIGSAGEETFIYERIDTELDDSCKIEMDATEQEKLNVLTEKAHVAFQNNSARVLRKFFNEPAQ